MDPDLNRYDLEHVVADHERMSREAWSDIYAEAWSLYYTPEHMERIMRRGAATGVPLTSLLKLLLFFSTTLPLEGVHPLQGGFMRVKRRSERRPGLPVEPLLLFYPKLAGETLVKHWRLGRELIRLIRVRNRIAKDPNRLAYADQALAPVTDRDDEELELLTQNEAARTSVSQAKRLAEITGSGKPAEAVAAAV